MIIRYIRKKGWGKTKINVVIKIQINNIIRLDLEQKTSPSKKTHNLIAS